MFPRRNQFGPTDAEDRQPPADAEDPRTLLMAPGAETKDVEVWAQEPTVRTIRPPPKSFRWGAAAAAAMCGLVLVSAVMPSSDPEVANNGMEMGLPQPPYAYEDPDAGCEGLLRDPKVTLSSFFRCESEKQEKRDPTGRSRERAEPEEQRGAEEPGGGDSAKKRPKPGWEQLSDGAGNAGGQKGAGAGGEQGQKAEGGGEQAHGERKPGPSADKPARGDGQGHGKEDPKKDVAAPKPEPEKDPNPCLCVFGIDRTLTAKPGEAGHCPGSAEVPGVADTASGTGTLVLSEVGLHIGDTFCGRCYRGAVTTGNAGGPKERATILEKLGGVKDTLSDVWSPKDKVTSSLVVGAPIGQGQESVRAIVAWFGAQKGITIEPGRVHYFDDSDKNVPPFAGTGYNARQVSCSSRGAADEHRMGLCGGTLKEVVPDTGVQACWGPVG